MKEKQQNGPVPDDLPPDTTMVEVGGETVSESTDAITPTLTMDRLKENYRNLVEQQAIYYPVAYRFVRELGRGRQGIVFLGLRQGSRGCITRHAIKLFDPTIYRSPKEYWTDMGRIAAQTSILQTIRSPNLVARDVYEETDGIGYVQMEAIRGFDLRFMLSSRHLETVRQKSSPQEWSRFTDVIFRLGGPRPAIQPGVALYIMRQILRGLETLHELGFLHCDVKPSNIMIDRLGYVKLIDYGRAIRIGERPMFLLGSPVYMAPEIHRREEFIIQSDIYSVGIVGLEMLSGRPLIERGRPTEAELLQIKRSLPEQIPQMLPEDVRRNETLVALLRRFVECDPQKRFASAGEAESSSGLRIVHRQLTQLGKDTEYGRELEAYLAKLLPPVKKENQSVDIQTIF
ncbi:MAG: hypothetical protein DRP22_01615 [Verrucomicrobia bacterium]|nr:MAG: hypothetical protein DRP22_01615 [Verrucomicrobiota bacterium]